MKNAICILSLILMISACNRSNQNANSTQSDTLVDTNKAYQDLALHTLDSIDKENNKSADGPDEDITKAFVNLSDNDSTIRLIADMHKNHRIIGYAEPGINSERLILFSIFTNDVENNPFGCKLGAYYDTRVMEGITLKYISTTGNFVKATATDKSNNPTTVYFEKKWIDIE